MSLAHRAVGLANARLALSNKRIFFLMYVRYALDFQSPMFLISGPVRPAAARVEAPPIRKECDETRLGSSPLIAASLRNCCAKYGGFNVQFSEGI